MLYQSPGMICCNGILFLFRSYFLVIRGGGRSI
uniref:Uncharacterized protein n=1 Tax=Rhizophora mucronata TaxID=61149 RepID=A0A2P2LX23_RHIMU